MATSLIEILEDYKHVQKKLEKNVVSCDKFFSAAAYRGIAVVQHVAASSDSWPFRNSSSGLIAWVNSVITIIPSPRYGQLFVRRPLTVDTEPFNTIYRFNGATTKWTFIYPLEDNYAFTASGASTVHGPQWATVLYHWVSGVWYPNSKSASMKRLFGKNT